MYKKTLLIILSIFICGFSQSGVFPNRPALPMEDGSESIHAIIVTEKDHFQKTLHMVKHNFKSLKVTHIYKHVFTGFSVKGKREEINQLKNSPGVKHGSQVATYHVSLDKSVPFIGGDAVRGYYDQLDQRLTGKGIKVGVIDTGVDYTHSDLERNYEGGYDLVDGDSDPMETKGTAQTKTIHGTHVVGIIAANGKVKGVAPEATIIAYRALGPGGVGTSEQVIAAIDKAIEDKVDIINLSLGNSVNGPDWPTSLALDKAAEKGIVAVTSSGNSGPNVWTLGSPGTSAKAISVGASTPPVKIPFLKMPLEDKELELMPLQGSIPWNVTRQTEFVHAGLGHPKDLANAKGKIALIERGEIPFTEKAMNASQAGAVAVLIYNNVKGNFAGSLEIEPNIPVASLSKEDGKWLLTKFKDGNSLIQTSFREIEDTLASFSSRGPVTNTWNIKPDVLAPGVAINSTTPDGYLELQGTSMAAPHVAGACALIKQAHPDWTPEQVKAALMNTAKLLKNDKDQLYKPYEQGAGRIQIVEAIKAETLIYPSALPFGMLHHEDERTEKSLTFTIDNQANETKKYSFDIPKNKNGLQWKLPISVSVEPKEKKEITVKLDITPSIIGAGLHHGNLYVTEGNNRIHLPYMFVIEEPDYPRLMGFQFGKSDKPNTYMYQLYLPRGAEEYGVALYEPDTLRFVKFLDWQRDVSRGLIERVVKEEDFGEQGVYKVMIFAKKANREDTIEAEILIGENKESTH